jgi:hypothetical protein
VAKQELTDTKCKAARERGLSADGGGLYLQVTAKGHRSWLYRFPYSQAARRRNPQITN